MSLELIDFQYFRNTQLHSIDFLTGRIDTIGGRGGNLVYQNVGSINPDGYERIWCNRKLRMKHRLIYFLYHGELPTIGEEIDHHDNVRHANHISNLRILTKSQNNSACAGRKIGRRTHAQIHEICALLQNTSLSDEAIAKQLGYITRATVRDIKTRSSRQTIGQHYQWTHRGY